MSTWMPRGASRHEDPELFFPIASTEPRALAAHAARSRVTTMMEILGVISVMRIKPRRVPAGHANG